MPHSCALLDNSSNGDVVSFFFKHACTMYDMVIDTFFTLQIKLSSVQLARKYMKRVASELDAMSGPEKEPNREFLILQGVRFAFRVHQVRLLLYPSFKFQRMISLFLKILQQNQTFSSKYKNMLAHGVATLKGEDYPNLFPTLGRLMVGPPRHFMIVWWF